MDLLDNMNMLSLSGQCFSFDHRADGYARGEGFGVLVVKRLTDALRDGDTIRAVIRETASNQDGFTPGITQPSSDSQAALVEETYRRAGLSMNFTRYVVSPPLFPSVPICVLMLWVLTLLEMGLRLEYGFHVDRYTGLRACSMSIKRRPTAQELQ